MDIRKYYQQVVNGNRYDYVIATNHNTQMAKSKIKAKELPTIEQEFVMNNHVGCCLHYGLTLFKLLRNNGIEAYMSATLEENLETGKKTDTHISVCYIIEGKRMIADPVETVKNGKGEYFDIPLEEFVKENGIVWLYDPYGEYGDELFFEGFFAHPIETLKGE